MFLDPEAARTIGLLLLSRRLTREQSVAHLRRMADLLESSALPVWENGGAFIGEHGMDQAAMLRYLSENPLPPMPEGEVPG